MIQRTTLGSRRSQKLRRIDLEGREVFPPLLFLEGGMEIKVNIKSKIGEAIHSQEITVSKVKTSEEMDFVKRTIKAFREMKCKWAVE